MTVRIEGGGTAAGIGRAEMAVRAVEKAEATGRIVEAEMRDGIGNGEVTGGSGEARDGVRNEWVALGWAKNVRISRP
jgi:hypothetical protein